MALRAEKSERLPSVRLVKFIVLLTIVAIGAERGYDRYVQSQPVPPITYHLAQDRMQLQQTYHALKRALKATAQADKARLIRNNLAMIEWKISKDPERKENLSQELQSIARYVYENHYYFSIAQRQRLIEALADGNTDIAQETFSQMRGADDDKVAFAEFMLGKIAKSKLNLIQALEHFKTAISKAPTQHIYLIHSADTLTQLYASLEDSQWFIDGARALLQLNIADSNKLNVAERLADTYQRHKQYKQELDIRLQMTRFNLTGERTDTIKVLLLSNTAETYLRLKDNDKAVEYYQQALTFLKNSGKANDAMYQLTAKKLAKVASSNESQ